MLSNRFTGDVSGYRKLTPSEVIEKVKKAAGPERDGFTCGMMGLFGGEPTLHFEYILEAARICREAGCISKMHTSGYISEDILRKILGVIDIISINVKASGSPSVYQRMDADSAVVFRNIEQSWKTPNVRTTIRDLVGPDVLPTREDVYAFGRWLTDHVSPNIPVMLETMYQPKDYIPDLNRENYLPFPNEEDGFIPYIRCRWVGLHLVETGLVNVDIPDPRLPKPCYRRIPHIKLGEPPIIGKPRKLSVADVKLAVVEFTRRHNSIVDPYAQLIHPRDIEVAASYDLSPEELLTVDPRNYESLLEGI
jgi:pyruvate-formate lyase-activating enzyme